MKHRIFMFQVIVLIALVMVSISCEGNKVVARAGNHVIYLQDLNEALASHRLGPQAQQSYPAMFDFLNTLIEDELITIDAYRKELDQDSSVVFNTKDFEERQVYLDVIQNKVISKVIPEDMVKEKYKQNAFEYQVRHIFRYRGEAEQKQVQQLKELRSQILRGAEFAALARQFSQDSLSAGKGGDLGFLQWGANNWGETFYAAIANLNEGQLSPVIHSDRGLHLILLQQVRAVEQPPFEEQKGQLQRDFFRTHVKQLDSTFYAFIDHLKTHYNAQVLDDNLDSLVSYIKNTATDETNPRQHPVEFLQNMDTEMQTMPLAVFTQGAYTVTDMYHTYRNISSMRRPVLADIAAIQEFLRKNIPRTLIIKMGYENGVHKKPHIRQAVKEEKEKLMRAVNRNRTIVDNIKITDNDVKAYFEQNQHVYEMNSKVKIQEIKTYSQEKAQELYQNLQAGQSFDSLLAKHAPNHKAVNELPFIAASDYGAVSRKAVKLNVGETSEPVKNGDSYSIIKVVERQPGTVPPYDQIKNRIRRELRVNMRREMEVEWLAELRETIPVVVYEHEIRKEFGFSNDE